MKLPQGVASAHCLPPTPSTLRNLAWVEGPQFRNKFCKQVSLEWGVENPSHKDVGSALL